MALVAVEHWDTATIDHTGFETAYPWDGNTGRSRYENRATLAGLALCSPIVGAAMLAGDDLIYIVHSPSKYVPDGMNPSPLTPNSSSS